MTRAAAGWLAAGAGLAVGYLWLGHRPNEHAQRLWWATGFMVAALAYVSFAIARDAPTLWRSPKRLAL